MSFPAAAPASGLDASIIIPTRSEAPNIAPLIRRLIPAISEVTQSFEIIFVDDSDDDTPQVVESVANSVLNAGGQKLLRLIHRPRHRRFGGLGGAVQEAFAQSQGEALVVMDADLQHPPEIIPFLIAPVLNKEVDLIAGTRFGSNSSDLGGLSNSWRKAVTVSTRYMVHRLVPRSKWLSDPLSGLFAINRKVIQDVELHTVGFKILLEITAKGNWNEAKNFPYHFDRRAAGRSKASLKEGMAFARHLSLLALNNSRARTQSIVQLDNPLT